MIRHDDHDLLARLNNIFFARRSYCKMIMFRICTCSLCVYFFFFFFYMSQNVLHPHRQINSIIIDILFFFFFSSCIKLYKLSLSIRKIRPITKVYRIKTMPSAARAFHLLRLFLSLPHTPFFYHHFLFLQTISSSIKPTVRIDRLDKYFNNYNSTIPDGGLSAVKAHDLEKREQSVSPSDKRKATARKTFYPLLLSFQLYIYIYRQKHYSRRDLFSSKLFSSSSFHTLSILIIIIFHFIQFD